MPQANRLLTLTVLALAALPAAAAAQSTDFQVNAYTTGSQYYGSAAVLPSGGFVVAWSGRGDGDVDGIFLRRFDDFGVPLGGETKVNTHTTSFQWQPSVAADTAGGFVVVWSSWFQDGSDQGVFGQRFDALGNTVGGEFQVNTFTSSRQYSPSVEMDPSGGFVVAWSSFGSDGQHWSVSAQRYNAAGVPQGGEFVVNTYTTYAQSAPSVATDGSGRFVIAWTGVNNQDGDSGGVFGQRYDASGVRAGGEFRINTYTTGFQGDVAVDADTAGNFVVVWTSYGQDGDQAGVFGQRYDAAGTPLGGEFQVNTYTTSYQSASVVAWNGQDEFVVTWTDMSQEGSAQGIFARRFTGDGASLGPEFRVNAYTTSTQITPAIAVRPDGGFLTLWRDQVRQGDAGVYARIIPDLIFEDGFESGDLTAWDVASTDGGDLSASQTAALGGTWGLRGVVDDTAGLYVQDDTPDDEGRYRARFSIDPNGFDPGEAAGKRRTRVFIGFAEAPTLRLMTVVLRRIGGQYSLGGRARRDDGSRADTGFFAITDAPHTVEMAWTRSSTPDASDGTYELWIDGTLRSTLTALDNNASGVDFARLGALSVKVTATGTLYWDAFDSRRVSYVGP
jgi:hypothetical protein